MLALLLGSAALVPAGCLFCLASGAAGWSEGVPGAPGSNTPFVISFISTLLEVKLVERAPLERKRKTFDSTRKRGMYFSEKGKRG